MYKKILYIFQIVFISIKISNSQVSVEDIKSYNGSSGGNDVVVKALVDNSGNIFVTGNSTDEFTSYIVTNKYNSSGILQWQKIYRSFDNSKDYAITATQDSLGNFIVGGFTYNTSYNFLLIKYNSQGDLLWVRVYDGLGNSDDRLTSLGVDQTGNIYATGVITNQSKDIGLLKYNSSGNLLWEKFYNSDINFDDTPNELQLDKNGFVYIIGLTSISNFNTNLILIKYNSFGDTIWVRTHNGNGTNSYGTSLVVDDSLNIFATGSALNSQSNKFDYITLRYNNAGVLQWIKKFNQNISQGNYNCRAEKIKIDEMQNIYVTGTAIPIITDDNFYVGIVTIKYSRSGDSLWVKRIQRPEYSDYNSLSLYVFDSNNIYLATYLQNISTYNDLFLIKYDSLGSSVWEYSINNVGDDRFTNVSTDNAGNVFAVGYFSSIFSSLDYKIIKFNQQGMELWQKSYNSENLSGDEATNILEDKLGNIYVAGRNNKEYIVLKYSPSFKQLWVAKFVDSVSSSSTQSPSIACDTSGNIYMTSVTFLNGKSNLQILKFSSAGEFEWRRKYLASGTSIIGPRSIYIDKTGNATIMAYDYNTSSLDFKILLLKYSSAGSLVLNKIHNNSTAQNSDRGERMILDEDDNIYVIGSNGGEVLTLKFSSSGDQIWERTFTNGQPFVKSLNDLFVDKMGNVNVIGFIGEQNQSYDYLCIKYDFSGIQKWVRTFNGLRNNEDMAFVIVGDTNGNVYVTGKTMNNPNDFRISIMTIKYDSLGNVAWMRNLKGINNGEVVPASLKLDIFSNVYVLAGYNTQIGNSFLNVKYKSNGDSIWSFSYNSSTGIRNIASSLLIDRNNNVMITGTAYGLNTSYDITTIKLSQVIGVNELTSNINLSYSLHQNYPNPFNPKTIINYDIMENKGLQPLVQLKVYDALGKEIATLVNEKLSAGQYEVEFDGTNFPSGIYFYKLVSVGFTDTKRMVLLK